MKEWFNRIKKYNWAFIIVWLIIFTMSYCIWHEIFNLIKKTWLT